MKMDKKLSITLLVAMFSLFIIGFGGAATAEAAGNCAETLLVNVSASDSTAFTNCRAFEADAARYTGLAAFYTNETNNVQRAFEADAARYTGLAAFYTAEAAGECLGIGSTDMTAVELVNCLSDSAYLADNPELMASHRFVVADGSAASQPVSVDIEVLRNNYYNNIRAARHGDSATQTDPAAELVDVQIRNHNYYDNLWTARHGDSAIQTDPAAEPVDIDFLLPPNYFRPGR